jgi:hypothetical protein
MSNMFGVDIEMLKLRVRSTHSSSRWERRQGKVIETLYCMELDEYVEYRKTHKVSEKIPDWYLETLKITQKQVTPEIEYEHFKNGYRSHVTCRPLTPNESAALASYLADEKRRKRNECKVRREKRPCIPILTDEQVVRLTTLDNFCLTRRKSVPVDLRDLMSPVSHRKITQWRYDKGHADFGSDYRYELSVLQGKFRDYMNACKVKGKRNRMNAVVRDLDLLWSVRNHGTIEIHSGGGGFGHIGIANLVTRELAELYGKELKAAYPKEIATHLLLRLAADEQTAALRGYGTDFFKDMNAVTLDQAMDNCDNMQTLYGVAILARGSGSGNVAKYLVATCPSTGETHIMPVHENCDTVEKAQHWLNPFNPVEATEVRWSVPAQMPWNESEPTYALKSRLISRS